MKHLAFLLSLLLCSVAALGQTGPELAGTMGQPHLPLPDLRAFLELSEEQIQQLHQAQVDLREQVQPVAETAAGYQRELQEQLGSEAPDPTRIGELVLQIHNGGQVIDEIRRGHNSQVVAALDAGQQEKLDPLRLAFLLQLAARQAATLNLIDVGPHPQPGQPPDGP